MIDKGHGVRFEQLQPMIVAAYIEGHPAAAPTVKQHLAAIRMLCDYLVVTGVLRMNPAAAVRGPAHSAKRGKTPVLTGAEARAFLEAIKTKTIIGLRDRAVVAVMVYTFGRVGAVSHMRVEDYYPQAVVVSAPRERRQASRTPRASSGRGVRRRLPGGRRRA